MLLVVRTGRVLTALLALVVLILGGGGWYVSGQVHADGLRVRPGVVERDLRVVAVGDGTLTLRGEAPELRTPGTYGVVWPGGYGQVSGSPHGGRDVSRPFRVLTGRAPERDALVGITADAFPDPRTAVGRAAQEVGIDTPAGRFPAWHVPGNSATWVVLVHGKGASRTEVLRMMRVPVRLGLPSLAITYRNDAVLPLDESRRHQYGRTEWEDLDAALGWAQQRGARNVVLVGVSMGGAIVAEVMERSPRRALVSGLVLDSPLLSFEDAVDLGASRTHLPLLGWSVPEPVTWAGKRLATLRYGVDWDALDRLDDTSWVRVPTLVVHGTGDTRVPFSGSQRLAEEQPSRVSLSRDDGVEHVESWNHDPFGYEDELRRFLGSVR